MRWPRLAALGALALLACEIACEGERGPAPPEHRSVAPPAVSGAEEARSIPASSPASPPSGAPGGEVAASPAGGERVLRVCADPNNLPYSNAKREGFEDRIAELLARDLGARLEYAYFPQRRGFIRKTLKAKLCDVVVGVPASLEMVATTAPYYRSTHVFVSRASRGLGLASFDDPRLRKLKVGVQVVGDDYANPAPAHALARRGIVDNVVGYTVYGNYADESPALDVVRAVERGEVDVAIAWGPLAGHAAKKSGKTLAVTPVDAEADGPHVFAFDIAMGVRHGDDALRAELDAFLTRRRAELDAILDAHGVPRLAPKPRARARDDERRPRGAREEEP